MKNAIRILVAALTFGAATNATQARPTGNSLSREAHKVIDAADELTREINLHFRHSSHYRHLVSDAAAIRREAAHIDERSHHVHGIDDLRHLQGDLKNLDDLVHHTGELVEAIGHGRRHGRGHTHGDTHHVEELIACINRSLHSMERMVSEMGRGCRHTAVRGPGRGHGGGYEVRYARPLVGAPIARRVIYQVLRRR